MQRHRQVCPPGTMSHDMCRHGCDGELRNVCVLFYLPRDAAQAEARAKSVDQMREVGFMIRRRKAGLLRFAAFGDERAEPDDVEAETGIDLVADRVESFGEQPRDAFGLTQWPCGAGLNAKHFFVGAEQRDLQQSRAFAAFFQHGREACRELLDGAEHILVARHRFGEALLGERGWNRQSRRDRFVLDAERLIERRNKISPKRAASGARGRFRMSSMRFSPTCASAVSVSLSSRSAERGSGAMASRSLPGLMMRGASLRTTAHAQPTVSATATRTCKPRAVSRVARSRASAASPPKRCAQPVISSSKPSGASRPINGV